MTPLIDERFLLGTETARRLYEEYAVGLPVIDYHGHLDAADLAADRQFDNLTQLWVASDPYKHRAMRIAGHDEAQITGAGDDRARFDVWAGTVPKTIGSPLFQWTALELKRYFGIDAMLSANTAADVWRTSEELLRSPRYSARQLLARAYVECVITSEPLLADLGSHQALAASGSPARVLPSLRADDALAVDSPDYAGWLDRLSQSTGCEVNSFDGFRQAVAQRLDYFAARGCRLSDHGLETLAYYDSPGDETARLYERRAAGEALSNEELARLRYGLLRFFAGQYAARGWIMQLHLGAIRHTSSRLRRLAGPAGGYAAMGPACDIGGLVSFLDELERADALPQTIVFSLNPADNAPLAVLTGSFAQAGVPGKLQLGPAWWYNDHAMGIDAHLAALASYGLLSTFIGMTTDSRSLLSMSRHEYFRRRLCDFLGRHVESGQYPNDDLLLGGLIQDVCYHNARRWILERQAP